MKERKKKLLSLFTGLAMLVSIVNAPVMAQNADNEYDGAEIVDGIVNDNIDNYGEGVPDQQELEEVSQADSGADLQIAAAFTQRTSSPNGNKYYYTNINVFYKYGYVGECTWYAWGRAYEILGSAPKLPTSGAGRWYNECNSYLKSNNYYAAKVGAIACYSGHVAVVEAVGSNGAPSAISEGGYCSSSTPNQTVEAISGRSDRWFHYGKDYTASSFKGYIYILDNADAGTGQGGSSVHTHSWSYSYESAHPHKEYRACSCNAKEYTGKTRLVSSCLSCYPVGNVKLTRSFKRTQKQVELYRNNVANANSYTLTLYRNYVQYGTYNMSGSSKMISGLQSGTYYAALTAKNTNTGQTKTAVCDSFTIVDTYQVGFNANGGTNAPSAQTKIQDENLSITSTKPSREHYTFKGWASNKTATEPQYEPGSYYTKNTPITLYAVWEPETYTISFDANGGMGDVPSSTITYGDVMKMPNTVVREGYYLKGWAKTKNTNTPDYRIGMDYKPSENMTLYAVWGNSTWGGTVATSFAGGDGTEQDPYQISNAGELAYLAKIVNEQGYAPEYKYYVLTDNINLAFREWRPIGVAYNNYQYFYGSFDGNGYTVSDLSISEGNEGSIGLFGKAKGSQIKNLNVYGEISGMALSNTAYIGAVVGNADNSSISGCNALYVNVSDISNTASIYSYMGALCGYVKGKISGCSASESSVAMKDGYLYTGIIAGYIKGSVEDCEVRSSGRLFGSNTETDNLYLGGICGYLEGSAEKCIVNAGHYSNTLKAKLSYIGGITGYSTGAVNLCTAQFDNGGTKSIDGVSYKSSIYAEGSNTSMIGGIVGHIAKGGKVTNCKYDGQSISSVNTAGSAFAGSAFIGGIAGQVYGNETKKITAQGGQALSRSSLPTRSGYKATWYTDSNLTKEYDFSQPVTEDLTLYARWTEGESATEIWDGTSEEPAYNASTKTYTVTNGKELAWISDVSNGVITTGTNFPNSTSFEGYTVELANDIYLNDISNVDNWETAPPANEWKPIGDKIYNFSGFLKGNKRSVIGMFTYGAGMFGKVASNGTVDSLTLKQGSITCVSGNCGSIVGDNGGTISDCFNYNKVKNNDSYSAGGIAGYNGGKITNSYNAGDISGGQHVGGIAGRHDRGTAAISNCYNSGRIYNDANAGGIAGYCMYSYSLDGSVPKIINCYNLGGVDGGVYAGGIVGYGCCNIEACYSVGSVNATRSSYYGGIAGAIYGKSILLMEGVAKYRSYIKNAYSSSSQLYHIDTAAGSADYCTISSVSTKTAAQIKILSNLSGFSSYTWGSKSNYNNGYPYLKSLEDTYKIYNITVIEDPENAALLNKCFVNVDGILYSQSSSVAAAGGAVGYAGMSSEVTSAPANNLLVIANRVSAKATGSANKAQAGKIIGGINYNALDFNNITSFDEMEVSAVNTANYANAEINSITGSEKQLSQITQARNLIQTFGPNTYQSLADLEDHPDAVWVVKSGRLPDLYYNLLRDISISDTSNGRIMVDKSQAVDDEIVTVTAEPNEGYRLNKIYVNGEEIVGTTFEVNGDSDVYATFIEQTPEYNVKVTATENAAASLVNVDALSISGISVMAEGDDITAPDGDEIKVNTSADEEYTVDAIYVNGEELSGNSFIITADSIVTMAVASISTDVSAVTGAVSDVGSRFATLSGSVEGDDSTVSRYIKYWAANDPETVYVTEAEAGSGDYTVEITNLIPETEYCYRMCDSGEIRSFTTGGYYYPSGDGGGIDESETAYAYSIDNISASGNKINVDITKLSNVSGTLIVAVYNSKNVLTDIKYKPLSPDYEVFTVSVDIDTSKADRIKAMIWNSLDDEVPISSPVEWRK